MFEDCSHLIINRSHSLEVLFALSLDPLVTEYIILICHICWLSLHHCSSLSTILVIFEVAKMVVTARALLSQVRL